MSTLCMSRPEAECEDCGLQGKLECRFRFRHLLLFWVLFLVYFIPAFAGMIRSGLGAYLWGWLAWSIFFFGYWELRILCSHCPYYAQQGRVLRCIANYGLVKTVRPDLRPVTRSEQIHFLVGVAITFGYPFPFMLMAGVWQWILMTGVGLLLFFAIYLPLTCPRCVNLSCVFNRVPEEVKQRYLELNPKMKEAWERER
jgi:hypothetical protein